jgi:hypothetical protein
MQIDVRLVPFYEKGFVEHFQDIASLLLDQCLYQLEDQFEDLERNI